MTIRTNVDQVEQIIQPRLSALGYHLRKALEREVWYISNRKTGTIYLLLNNGLEWHINEMSGSDSEREMLEKEVRDAIFLGEKEIAAHEEGGTDDE
jgi:hypothetical protein